MRRLFETSMRGQEQAIWKAISPYGFFFAQRAWAAFRALLARSSIARLQPEQEHQYGDA
jgi:hypothetical protein